MNNPAKKTLTIVSQPIAAAIDGHQLSINSSTKMADLNFFQIQQFTPNESEELQGVSVAHIRMTISQLQKLNEDITGAINNINKKA